MGFSPESCLTLADEARCRRILRCATEAFLAHGFAGTAVENIAIEANVSKVTIYRFFTDKLGLATAVLKDLSNSLESECETALDMDAPPERCLVDFALSYHRWMNRVVGKTRNYAFLRFLIEISGPHPEFSSTWIDVGNRSVVRPLARYLQKCVEERQLWMNDPYFCATQFIGYVYHPSQSILSDNQYNDDAGIIARKVNLFLRGCAVRPV